MGFAHTAAVEDPAHQLGVRTGKGALRNDALERKRIEKSKGTYKKTYQNSSPSASWEAFGGGLEASWTALQATCSEKGVLEQAKSAQDRPKTAPRPRQERQEGGQELPQTSQNVTKRRFVQIRTTWLRKRWKNSRKI